ncbi:MAG: adenylate/guanylate cyclase domain-containing protein [Ignavibacteria bacterium]|nr:adenylate/guanylate cyclase domain-containing protein [Ignavibacteria bacterium]
MEKPTGTVTFIFTDIEGSTKLSQQFVDAYPAALEKHHAILRSAIESNNGYVFRIAGDAFCCAFGKAEDAVKAAIDIQLNLANEKWEQVVIKIRIGLHRNRRVERRTLHGLYHARKNCTGNVNWIRRADRYLK